VKAMRPGHPLEGRVEALDVHIEWRRRELMRYTMAASTAAKEDGRVRYLRTCERKLREALERRADLVRRIEEGM